MLMQAGWQGHKARHGKRSSINTLTLIVCFFTYVGVTGCKQNVRPVDAMARVNNKFILRSQVEARCKLLLGSDRMENLADNGNSLRLAVLQQLIREEIIQQQAEKLHLAATDDEIDEKVAELRGTSTVQFDAQLAAQNLTIDDLKGEIRRVRSEEKLFNKEVNSKISIRDADISHYYAAHKEDFNQTEPGYHLAAIVIKIKTPDQAVDRVRIAGYCGYSIS
jgi:peptidyl-prolyl cis-trans isomerase SurA